MVRPKRAALGSLVPVAAGLVAVGGVLAELAAARSSVGWDDPRRWLPDLLLGWVVLGCSVWSRRGGGEAVPLLLLATGALWFLGTAVPATASWHRAPLIHLLAATPAGWPRQRAARAVVVAAWPVVTLVPGAPGQVAALVLVAAAVVVRAVHPPPGTTPWARWLPAVAGAGWAAVLAVGAAGLVGPEGQPALLLGYLVAVATVAITCAWVAATTGVAALFDHVVEAVELGAPGGGALQAALRRATSDSSLVVALWDPVSATFHDAGGRPVRLEADRDRRVTAIDRGGVPLALVLHDQALPAAARLTEAVAAAVSLLDAHAALQQALSVRIAEVRRSRRRLLLAADAEREALARELARGPGARLAALRRRIAETAPDVVDDAAADDLGEAAHHLAVTAEDLDALLAGLRPAELDQGLASALTALAERSPVPAALDLRHRGAVAAEVEAAAYYVAAEALANVAKHARATSVRLESRTEDGDVLVLRVCDDGTGDVDPARGTGITGLLDRAAALGGWVSVTGNPGAGTVVEARWPVPSSLERILPPSGDGEPTR